ncbi:MAG: hypothetical protein ACLPRE_02960 [Limisphaerales bacterium]
MTNDNGNPRFSNLDGLRRYVPLAVWAIVILVILAIPLKIISYGFLPGDDALRHAAKAVSGKPWTDIVVMGPSFIIDTNFGWHLLLRQIFLFSKCSTEGLVLFSVVALFALVNWAVLPWLKRPEAWLVALLAVVLASDLSIRFTLGRPFILTIAGLLTILFVWYIHGPSPPKWWTVLWMAPLIALCTFVHGVWYLWLLPVAAFFLAGQFRWGWLLIVGWLAGVFLGASLTGHPFESLYQALVMAYRAFEMHATQRTLVSEFRPSSGDVLALALFGGLLVLRQLAGLKARPLACNPAFWLFWMSWVLSFKATRFMDDWGLPALMMLIACDVELLLQARFASDSFRRLALTCGLAAAVFLAITSDANSRWSQALAWDFLTPDNSAVVGWVPDKGGIFYSADMNFFYQTFYKTPNADWRYLVAFEPAFMPDEDFKVYEAILWNLLCYGNADEAYLPWVDKMRPQDRLAIREAIRPNIPELEWKDVTAHGLWIGRLPRTNAPSPALTIPAPKPPENSRH